MPRLQLDETALEYVERGSGEPLVLVHGSVSDYRTWKEQWSVLGRYYRTLAYSRRYHWPNDPIPPGADYAMQDHVDDLETLIRSLRTPAHVYGHSYGALVGLLLAMKAPRLVRSLVLAEPPAITLFVSNTPRLLEILKLLLTRPRTATAIVGFGMRGMGPAVAALRRGEKEKCLESFGQATLGSETFRRLTPERREQTWANFIEAEWLGSGFPRLDAEPLRQLRVPILLLGGERSPRLFHRVMDRLQELLPHARRKQIPSASHIMHEDNPHDTNFAVLSFLQRQDSA